MIPMPFILANIVLNALSLIFFCVTSAALLSKYPAVNAYLPARLRNQRILAFIGHGLLLAGLAMAIVFFRASFRSLGIPAWVIYEAFLYIGTASSIVLAYQFLDRRYFLAMPKLQRRLLIGTVSIVATFVLVIAGVVAVMAVFVIR